MRRLGLAAPIVQGPFGSGLSSVDLVVAVSESGGLGSFGVHHLDGAGIRKVAGEIRARTQRPFALNLWIPLGDSDDPQLSDARWNAACELLRPYFIELEPAHAGTSGALRARFREQIETVLELKPPVFSFVFGVPGAAVLERCRRAGIVTLGAATTAAEAKLLAACRCRHDRRHGLRGRWPSGLVPDASPRTASPARCRWCRRSSTR